MGSRLRGFAGSWVRGVNLRLVIFVCETFVREPWRGHFRLGSALWELTEVLELPLVAFGVDISFGNLRSETVVREPSRVELRLGTFVNNLHLASFVWRPSPGDVWGVWDFVVFGNV